MIKIQIEQIENWDYIKQTHSIAVEKIISNRLKNFKRDKERKRPIYIAQDSGGKLLEINAEDILCLNHMLGKNIMLGEQHLKFESSKSNVLVAAIGLKDAMDRYYQSLCLHPTFAERTVEDLNEAGKFEKWDMVSAHSYNGETSNNTQERWHKYQDLSKYEDKYKDILKYLINYDAFVKGVSWDGQIWDRHKFLISVGISVCPYCNRQYISSYGDKTTADVDHFYPKSKYPFLALSIYNLIPSCQICNSKLKGQCDPYMTELIYPYDGGDSNEIKFVIESENINYLLGESDQFNIVAMPGDKGSRMANNTIDVFKLNDIYAIHRDYVQEIIMKSYIYNENKIKEMLYDFPEIFESEEEIIRIIFGNYIHEGGLCKRPLAKLTRDIYEQLDIHFNK